MASWGWRLPFLVAAPLGLVGGICVRLDETPVFRDLAEADQTEETATTAFRDLITGYWRPILRLGGLVVALNVVNYTLLTYMPTYLEGTIGLSADVSLVVPIIGMLSMMVFLPFARPASDPFAAKPMWWLSLAGLFVAGVPMFLLMGTGPGRAIIASRCWPAVRAHWPPLARRPSGDVPDPVRFDRIRDRLQRVDGPVRRDRPGRQRLAGGCPGSNLIPAYTCWRALRRSVRWRWPASEYRALPISTGPRPRAPRTAPPRWTTRKPHEVSAARPLM